jgi:hypothetical protein
MQYVQNIHNSLPPPAPNILHQAQCDPGANISATHEVVRLSDMVTMEHLFPISSADRKGMPMTATIKGTFVLLISDGTTCNIPMYYCALLIDTIFSPQHFTSPAITDRLFNGYFLIDLPGCCHMLLSHSMSNDAEFIDRHKSNNIYFILGSGHSSTGSSISRLATKPQMSSELWHQRLGHPGHGQLSVLAQHSTGLPSKLMDGLHPMHSFQACDDGKIKSAPMGDTSEIFKLLPGTRFHLDFGFIWASSLYFGMTAGLHNFTSYNGNNNSLLIFCARSRHTWPMSSPHRPHQSISSNAFYKSTVSKTDRNFFAWIKAGNCGDLN